jgi:hypothetical protein
MGDEYSGDTRNEEIEAENERIELSLNPSE